MTDERPRKRLGGWWRLFIIYSVLWGIYCFNVMVNDFPRPEWAFDPLTKDIYTPEYMHHRKVWAAYGALALFAFGTLGVLAVVGIGRWVYRGFKPKDMA